MKLGSRLVLVIIISILFIGMAFLLWANQTGKITIWGEGPGETKPDVYLGLPITIDGTLTKEGDYYVLTNNKQLEYNVYILNSQDTQATLEPFLNKEVSVYGSLGGEGSNQLFVYWANGETIYTESVGRYVYQERLARFTDQTIDNFSQAQKNCLDNVVSKDQLESFLSNPLNNLSDNQIKSINECYQIQ